MCNGLENERLIVNYINDNSFDSYNNNIQNFLSFLFPEIEINENSVFTATLITRSIKPDICICYNNIKKYISIKKGNGNSIHQESLDSLCSFISQEFSNQNIINDLKLFHYGDDTINNTGTRRYSSKECKQRYIQSIQNLNNFFNQSTNIVRFLDRFLFIGNIGDICVDAIYHGNCSNGIWASYSEIINFFQNFQITNNNAVYFGPMTYQVWGRNVDNNAKYPNRRFVSQIKWGSIMTDLGNIRNN